MRSTKQFLSRVFSSGLKSFANKTAIAGLCALLPFIAYGASPPVEVPIANWKNAVTSDDFGFDDFHGNAGLIRPPGVQASVAVNAPTSASARLALTWDFGPNREGFAGLFWCLGVCETKVLTGPGTSEGDAQSASFPEHALNLDDMDGIVRKPARRVDALKFAINYAGAVPLVVRVELKDSNCLVPAPGEPPPARACGGRYTRFTVTQATKSLTWDFRKSFSRLGGTDLQLEKAKSVVLLIEGKHIADKVETPISGELDVRGVSFLSSTVIATAPRTDRALFDEIELRAVQYFIDHACAKRACNGLPQDRSTFPDLLTVGGLGFSLPALVIGAERGWISRSYASGKVLSALRILAERNAYGPEAIGRIGYLGFLYHFLSLDGRRKRNFDFDSTPRNEALNTVELSTIDTALAVWGVLVVQSYFNANTPREREIRALAQQIFDAVEWPFMLDPATKQWILGWKPLEIRDAEPPFERADAQGLGHYASRDNGNAAATLDYYTDEALVITILAAGSRTHAIAAPKDVYCALNRTRDKTGLIRTWPGALFTYNFLSTFLDTRTVKFAVCPGDTKAVDWFANSRKALVAVVNWARQNPDRLPGYGLIAWFIDAVENAGGIYSARGAKPLRVPCIADQACASEEEGTLAYYAVGEAMNLHDAGRPLRLSKTLTMDIASNVAQILRRAWLRGHVHPRFGLADAYTDNISAAVARNPTLSGRDWIRRSGPWVQRTNFAINQGPLLMGLENSHSRLIWRLLASNPNVKRGLQRLR